MINSFYKDIIKIRKLERDSEKEIISISQKGNNFRQKEQATGSLAIVSRTSYRHSHPSLPSREEVFPRAVLALRPQSGLVPHLKENIWMPGGLPSSVQVLALGPHSITTPRLGLTSLSAGLTGGREDLSHPSQSAFMMEIPGFSAMSILISLEDSATEGQGATEGTGGPASELEGPAT